MRYYELNLYQPGVIPGTTKPFRTWTTHPGGQFDPGALMLEMDLIVLPYAVASGGSTITLHGVAMEDLNQSQQFGMHPDAQGIEQPGMTLELRGGMKAGLPLANPAQADALIVGQIFQSYGNWRGTDMRLDLVVYPPGYTMDNPGNFVLNWKRGQKLSDALGACLAVVYPAMPIRINISGRIVADQDMPHFCSTLEELAQTVKDTTKSHYLGKTYPGVDIAIHGGVIDVFDGTVPAGVVQLNFTDLVGQPTWVDKATVQFDTVLRGDIQIGSVIKAPQGMTNQPGMVVSSQASLRSGANNALTFVGDFKVTGVRHVGNSRSPNAGDWATFIQATPIIPTPGTVTNGVAR
ncbi:MAG TPA: hypothetical protein VFR20_00025 [Burkholderiaceae bacterium]|nr:hypothetical protein [Burkholderiaceae bacterium]